MEGLIILLIVLFILGIVANISNSREKGRIKTKGTSITDEVKIYENDLNNELLNLSKYIRGC